MADPNFQFNPSDGHNNTVEFPTTPSKEQVRGLMQRLHDQTRDFINNTLIAWVKNTFATKTEIGQVVLGQIPDGTITPAKLNFDPATQAELDAHLADYAKHLDDLSAHGDIINTYRSNKDANGIFTAVEYKRLDGTLAKRSVLSGGISPKYTTRTVTYYAANGTTVLATKAYTITYTGDDLTSEVTT